MLSAREHATEFNKAPVVRALTALLMVIAILCALTRLVVRLLTMGNMKLDDSLIAAATVVAIAQSIIVIFEGASGLGKHDGLGEDQVSSILKSQYAADVFFIVTLTLAKISATRTIWNMAPRELRRLILAIEGLIGLWAVSSIVGHLFQCSLPKPWDYINEQCFNRAVFWTLVNSFNIVTDLAITAMLIGMFWGLKTSASKKALVIGVFGSRVFIIPAIALQIYYFNKAVNSDNPMFDMWLQTVLTQVVQCLSVITTCIPFLKPFLDSLESGKMQAGDPWQTRTKSSNNRSKTGGQYASGGASRNRDKSRGLTSIATLASNASHRRQKYEMVDMDRSGADNGKTKGTTATVTSAYQTGSNWDMESHTSQTVLVHQTWQVDVERKDSVVAVAR